jgi:hypothetical protein
MCVCGVMGYADITSGLHKTTASATAIEPSIYFFILKMPPNSNYLSIEKVGNGRAALFFFGDHVDVFNRAFFGADAAALAIIEIDVEFLLVFLVNNAFRAYSFAHGAARAFIVFVNRLCIAPVTRFIVSRRTRFKNCSVI